MTDRRKTVKSCLPHHADQLRVACARPRARRARRQTKRADLDAAELGGVGRFGVGSGAPLENCGRSAAFADGSVILVRGR